MRSLVENGSKPSFFERHEFLLRRLHSLTGLVPVGAYMVIHLATNATIWNGPASFQRAVYQIHSLGILLPIVEWTFIFLPLLFHGIYGIAILRESQPNSGNYPFANNIRYTLQRATGLIAFLFIGWHVFHMHGWIHVETWEHFIQPWGANFRPYNATSTAIEAMQQSPLVIALYFIGVAACVFHLANGIWTMGITWGIWTTAAAQRRANYIALIVGVIVMSLGVAAWSGFSFGVNARDKESLQRLIDMEHRLYQEVIQPGLLDPEDELRLQRKRRPMPSEEVTARPEPQQVARQSDGPDAGGN